MCIALEGVFFALNLNPVPNIFFLWWEFRSLAKKLIIRTEEESAGGGAGEKV